MARVPVTGHPQLHARFGGAAYQLIFALAIAANFGVLEPVRAAGDAETVMAELLRREGAFRLAIAAMLVVLMCDLVVAWMIHVLFSGAAPSLAALTVLFRVAYTIAHVAIVLGLVDAMQHAEKGDALAVVDALNAHAAGFTITLLFFGVHLILLGVLIWRVQLVPVAIGVLLGLAGAGYLADGFGWLLVPDLRAANSGLATLIVVLPALVGEGALTGWLLVRGMPRKRWNKTYHAG